MILVQALSRHAHRQAQVWRSCYVQLRARHALTMSAALCYRTIFALVPLLLLGLLVLKSMGMVDRGRQYLDDILSNAGLRTIATTDSSASGAEEEPACPSQPAGRDARDKTVADHIRQQIDSIESKLTFSALGPVGAVLLIWTALGLLVTMEDFLNRIFGVSQGRSWRRRVLTYWGVVTLGPLFLSAATYLGNAATCAVVGLPCMGPLVILAAWITPLAVGVLVLAGIYTWMPNTRVRFGPAIAGSAVSVALWILAKRAFFVYVERVAHKSLYGAMGALPLFLLWMYLSWAIFLLGAQLTAVLNDPRILLAGTGQTPLSGPWQRLAATLAVASRFLGACPAPASAADVGDQAQLSESDAQNILAGLAEANILAVTAPTDAQPESGYVLARAPECLPLLAVLGLAPAAQLPPSADPAITQALQQAQARLAKAVGELTLADVLNPARKPD